MKYRLTFYDNQKKYKEVHLLDTEEEVKQKLNTTKHSVFTVHKCNDRGNNYSRRDITANFLEI